MTEHAKLVEEAKGWNRSFADVTANPQEPIDQERANVLRNILGLVSRLAAALEAAEREREKASQLLAKFSELIVDADHISRERFEYYGLCDQLDNNGRPYPSQFSADMLVEAKAIKNAALAPQTEK